MIANNKLECIYEDELFVPSVTFHPTVEPLPLPLKGHYQVLGETPLSDSSEVQDGKVRAKHQEQRCYACNRPSSKICNGCGIVTYCDKACQMQDRNEHKKACKRLGDPKKREACAQFWALDNISEISEQEQLEIDNHRMLLGRKPMERDGDVHHSIAMMISDIYSSDYLASYEMLVAIQGRKTSDHDEFKQALLIPNQDTRHKSGDSFLICLYDGEERICYCACIVRCPVEQGARDAYRVFQSCPPRYGLREWLSHPEKFEFGGSFDRSKASAYAERVRDATGSGLVASSALQKLLGYDIPEFSSSCPNFYFKHATFTLSVAYANSERC